MYSKPTFWATRADALLGLQDTLIFLLAGQVAPTALLPGVLRQAATVLPFRYMIGFPVEVLTGQLDAAGLRVGFAFQIGWLAVALALFSVMWRAGVKRYSAVGMSPADTAALMAELLMMVSPWRTGWWTSIE